MEYEAQFGKVKTGDYVVVVTNDYTHRDTHIGVGKVVDDGYVYLGTTQVSKGGAWIKKASRRQIGSFGCPVCKLNKSDVSEEVRKDIEEAIKLTQEKQKASPRHFACKIVQTTKKDGVVQFVTTIVDKVMKKSLPADMPKDAVDKEVRENLWRRYRYYIEPTYTYDYTNGFGSAPKDYVEQTSEVEITEVTAEEYARVKYSKETKDMVSK